MGKVRCQCTHRRSGTTADVNDRVELPASGGVMVDDELEELRFISKAILGIREALSMCVGPECTLRLEFSAIGLCVDHGS